MTIPFGRRRLVVSVALAAGAPPARRLDADAGGTDAELARLGRGPLVDIDRARWDALTLIYGGHRRP